MRKIYLFATLGVLLLAVTACGDLESLFVDSEDTRFVRIAGLGESIPVGTEDGLILTVSWSFGPNGGNKSLDSITWEVSDTTKAAMIVDPESPSRVVVFGIEPGNVGISVTVESGSGEQALVTTRMYPVVDSNATSFGSGDGLDDSVLDGDGLDDGDSSLSLGDGVLDMDSIAVSQ